MQNFGQANALMCGFHHCTGDYVITMDDHLQNPPEEIPNLIKAIEASGDDLVFGVPKTKHHNTIRKFGSSFYRTLMAYESKYGYGPKLSNFRIILRDILNHITADETSNPVISARISSITNRASSIFVEHFRRPHAKSNYKKTKLVLHFLNGVVYNTTIPLKAIALLGLGTTVLSFGLGCYYFGMFLWGDITIPGWTTLVLLILFFSGLNMFSLGIIGEYLIRIIQEVHRRPQYIIRQKEM